MELAGSPKVISVYLVVQTLTLLQTCYSQCFDPTSLIIYNYENSVPDFNLLTNAEMGMCKMVCNKFELCLSVDWIREKKTCRLNTRFAIKNGTSLMTEGRIIHVDRENFPKHLAADCPMHICTEDAICLRGNCVPVLKEKVYKDCSDIVKRDPSKKGQNGVYVIYPDTGRREVFCDMTTDGGGWTMQEKF
ncbi:uncharacterized protein LOC134242283 [Saccostrea cucullata]|uniref:uncharacterized protein LOC134242283 n=1 Tax=Saccostrea cuccullata TaxID=36930 RepID=UPI002ED502DA